MLTKDKLSRIVSNPRTGEERLISELWTKHIGHAHIDKLTTHPKMVIQRFCRQSPYLSYDTGEKRVSLHRTGKPCRYVEGEYPTNVHDWVFRKLWRMTDSERIVCKYDHIKSDLDLWGEKIGLRTSGFTRANYHTVKKEVRVWKEAQSK
jgi:hypothetical protein